MSKGKKVIGFVVVLLVLGVATFGGVYFGITKSKDAEEKVVVIEEAFHEVGEMFIKLNDDKAKRYVKLNMSVSFDKENKDLAAEILDKQVVMRDVSIYYLMSLNAEAFETENEEKLKSDLIERMNQKLTKGTIMKVYISDIMVQ